MKRVYQTAALCFRGPLGLCRVGVWNLEYYTSLGPAPGSFPSGWSCSGRALARLARPRVRSIGKAKDRSFLPHAGDCGGSVDPRRLAAMAGLMNFLGFQLSMFLFVLFLLMVLGRQSLWVTLVVALLGSVGVYRLFGGYLDVSLPAAGVKFLANLGL